MFVRDTKLAQDRSDAGGKLFAVGNPSFDRSAFPDLEDLPTAASEVDEISEFYDRASVVLKGPKARKASVLSAMPQAGVVHLATHYLPEPNEPKRSRLLLASDAQRSGSDGLSDGVLQAYEIYKLTSLKAQLAVLSACQTGVEENLDGEGAIGLARPFKASVPLVVASLWPVDSKATTELMINFHRLRRRQRLSSAEALRAAQLQMLRHSNPSYHRPYYWASFVLIGGYSSY
jgi:CHAT domain-containing protein